MNKKKYEGKENEKKETLFEFKMKNIYELYVDMLYYFSSPEILKNRKITHRTKYDLYKDLDSENFIKEQKRRIKTILNLPGIGPDLVIKSRKLLNYRKIFSAELDGFNKDKDNETKFDNINILRTKMEKYSFLCLSENNETKILDYLNELKEEFKKVTIDIKILGLVHFNFIENNLVLLLTIIMNKLEKNKNKKNINDFISVCTNILNYFKSSKLFFFIIKYAKQNIDLLEILNSKDDLAQFIPNNMINFKKIEENIHTGKICNLEEILKFKDKNINYYTMIYDNYLLIYFDTNEISEVLNYNYLKIYLIDRKIVYKGKIDLIENENIKKIDFNMALKNNIIYFISVVEKDKKYFFKYILLNKYSSGLIKKGEIELNNNLEPFLLLNDDKYFYCLSKNNIMIIMKKNYKLDNIKYVKYNLASNIINNFSNFSSFKNYNSLFFNNLFVVKSSNDEKKYFIKFIKIKDDNYLLNYSLVDSPISDINKFIRISFNDNKCFITLIDNKSNNLLISAYSKNNQYYNDKGILLLPFNSYQYINESNNIYEYLLQEYSSYINIFGNFDMLIKNKEYTLIDDIFSLCCNFDEINLDFIIQNIIENDNCDNIKLYYIIILKQLICSLYNTNNLNEKTIKDVIPFFKNFILNNIKKEENKIFSKILKEIVFISSYIKNKIIEIKDIKFIFDENDKSIKNKIKLLLIELLLEQKKTQRQKTIV